MKLTRIAGIMVWCRDGTCDGDVATSCMVEDEYRIRVLAKPEAWFVDLGAHCGYATVLAASLGMRCVAVEPLPENLLALRFNVGLNDYAERVTIVPRAIGFETLYTGDDAHSRHRYIATGHRMPGFEVNEFQAKTTTLDEILDPLPSVRMIKTDCEGGEWSAFAESKQLWKVDYIVGEHHPGGVSFEDFRDGIQQFEDVSAEFGYKPSENQRMFAFRRR